MIDQQNILIEEIGPKKASEYLGVNRRNRSLRPEVVNMYAEQMVSGEWRMTGDPIRFSRKGALLDGQHRLAAIIQSGVILHLVVIRGLEFEDQLVMDTGVRRSFGDHLKIMGEPYAAHLAAMVRGVALYEANGTLVANRVSAPVLKETLTKYPELRDGVPTVFTANRETGLGFNAGGFAWWRFNQLDRADCKEFFDKFTNGTDLVDGNPILALRKVFLSDIRGRRNYGLRANVKSALTVKAWNKWRAGEPAHSLRYVGGGTHGENFPEAI